MKHRGLSLIEVIIVVVLISTLMAVSLPMLSRANAKARVQLCQQNLADIGQSLAGYANDHNRFPAFVDDDESGESLATFMAPRLDAPHALYCPSDETQLSRSLGTSYRWDAGFNGVSPSELSAMVGRAMLADREAYHQRPTASANALTVRTGESGFYFSVLSRSTPETSAIEATFPPASTTTHQ